MTAATVQDVATSLGRPITDSSEVAQVEQWLADAEMVIRLRLGDVSTLDQAALAFVEREAVILKMRNPEGYSSETIDDYTYRWGDSQGRVVILNEWWNLLTPAVESEVFSTRPGFEADAGSNVWVTTTEKL